jgi:hypothetical protein
VDDGQAHLEVIRHPKDAGHALRGILSRPPLTVAADETGQCDDTVFHGHRDIGLVDVRVEAKLLLHVPV